MSIKNILNGVNIQTVEDSVKVIEKDPGIAAFKFRLKNRWIDGGLNRALINNFYGARQENSRPEPFVLDADEPPMLAGRDLGTNPLSICSVLWPGA